MFLSIKDVHAAIQELPPVMVVEEVGRLAEISGLDSDYRHLELGQLQPQHLCCDQWSHWSHLSQ